MGGLGSAVFQMLKFKYSSIKLSCFIRRAEVFDSLSQNELKAILK